MMKNYNKHVFSKLSARDSLVMFLSVFISEFVCGVYLSYFKGILLNDAFSRTANAFYVLYTKPIRLASVGFVWNPLPSILQLPFVELSKLWRPIASSEISAVIVTAASAAFGALILFKAFTRFNIQKKYSIIITLLYAFNPFIFFYGMNGMSEETFFLAAIYAVINMTLWMKEGNPEYIIKIAIALTVAFFCRYEAIPFAGAIGLGVLINIFFGKKEKKFIPSNMKKEKYYYAEGTAIVLYAPLIYGILFWIFLNWTIMGNPLYFLNSTYSNSSQSEYTSAIKSQVEALTYVIQRAIPFMILFFAIILIRLAVKRVLKSDFFILCILVSTMLIFHFLMIIKGKSYGWLRFFSYSLPICIAWIPYEMSEVKKIFKKSAFIIICVSLVISSALTYKALSDPVLGVEEHYVVVSQESKEIAQYINEELPDEKVMMDSFTTSGIILNVNNINNLIISSNLNFNECLNNLEKYRIKYIVVPDPDNGTWSLDAFNKKYHNLYKNGADWCTLKKEFENYKIFEVTD